MSKKTDAVDSWVKARGFVQPYENSPYVIRIDMDPYEIWIDLSDTEPKQFNKIADESIADFFKATGRNEIRKNFHSLMKAESLGYEDPFDFNY